MVSFLNKLCSTKGSIAFTEYFTEHIVMSVCESKIINVGTKNIHMFPEHFVMFNVFKETEIPGNVSTLMLQKIELIA